MLLWHVVLVPIVLVAIVGAHVLLVRVRGVAHPLPAHLGGPGTGKERRRAQAKADAAPWRGPTRRYDILKEGTIATAVVLGLTVLLAALLSSPDVPSATVAELGQDRAGRLPGHRGDRAQRHQRHRHLRAALQQRHRRRARACCSRPPKITGVTQPINTAQDFVLGPLDKLTATNPRLATALATYHAAPPAQQMAWANAYLKAVTHVKFAGGLPVVPPAADGPVPVMLATEYTMAPQRRPRHRPARPTGTSTAPTSPSRCCS